MSALLLSDLNQWFGSDLTVSNSGDIQTVTGSTRGEQRVLRRLMTNPGDYLSEPTYGAGLPQWIGRPLDIPKMTALCVSQMLLENVVAKSPAPTVSISQIDASSFSLVVSYTDQPTTEAVVLNAVVSP